MNDAQVCSFRWIVSATLKRPPHSPQPLPPHTHHFSEVLFLSLIGRYRTLHTPKSPLDLLGNIVQTCFFPAFICQSRNVCLEGFTNLPSPLGFLRSELSA